jgi:hypothetical protein
LKKEISATIARCETSTTNRRACKIKSGKKVEHCRKEGKAWGSTFVLGEKWKNGITVIYITPRKWK